MPGVSVRQRALAVVTDQTRLQTCCCGRKIRARLLVSYMRAGIVRQLLKARVWVPIPDGHRCPGRGLGGLEIDYAVIDELEAMPKGAE